MSRAAQKEAIRRLSDMPRVGDRLVYCGNGLTYVDVFDRIDGKLLIKAPHERKSLALWDQMFRSGWRIARR